MYKKTLLWEQNNGLCIEAPVKKKEKREKRKKEREREREKRGKEKEPLGVVAGYDV